MGSPTQSVIITVTRDILAWPWKLWLQSLKEGCLPGREDRTIVCDKKIKISSPLLNWFFLVCYLLEPLTLWKCQSTLSGENIETAVPLSVSAACKFQPSIKKTTTIYSTSLSAVYMALKTGQRYESLQEIVLTISCKLGWFSGQWG